MEEPIYDQDDVMIMKSMGLSDEDIQKAQAGEIKPFEDEPGKKPEDDDDDDSGKKPEDNDDDSGKKPEDNDDDLDELEKAALGISGGQSKKEEQFPEALSSLGFKDYESVTKKLGEVTELQKTIARLEAQSSKAPKFANNHIAKLNHFAEKTNISDVSVFGLVNSVLNNEAPQYMDVLLAKELIESESARKNPELAKKALYRKYNLSSPPGEDATEEQKEEYELSVYSAQNDAEKALSSMKENYTYEDVDIEKEAEALIQQKEELETNIVKNWTPAVDRLMDSFKEFSFSNEDGFKIKLDKIPGFDKAAFKQQIMDALKKEGIDTVDTENVKKVVAYMKNLFRAQNDDLIRNEYAKHIRSLKDEEFDEWSKQRRKRSVKPESSSSGGRGPSEKSIAEWQMEED